MNRIKPVVLIFFWVFSITITILLLPYYKVIPTIKTWFQVQNQSTDISIKEIESFTQKSNVLQQYYLAHKYKSVDIQKAITIAEQYLESNQNAMNKEKKLITFILLGELYFYSQDYQKSVDSYWNSLLLDPSVPQLRYNYELALYFSDITNSKDIEKQANITFSSDFIGIVNDVQKMILPISLDKVIINSEYFFYIHDPVSAGDKQW